MDGGTAGVKDLRLRVSATRTPTPPTGTSCNTKTEANHLYKGCTKGHKCLDSRALLRPLRSDCPGPGPPDQSRRGGFVFASRSAPVRPSHGPPPSDPPTGSGTRDGLPFPDSLYSLGVVPGRGRRPTQRSPPSSRRQSPESHTVTDSWDFSLTTGPATDGRGTRKTTVARVG